MYFQYIKLFFKFKRIRKKKTGMPFELSSFSFLKETRNLKLKQRNEDINVVCDFIIDLNRW